MKVVSRDDCPWCDKAIELIKKNGDEYEVFELANSEVQLYRFLGHKTVPHIVGIGGYTDLVRYYEEKDKGR